MTKILQNLLIAIYTGISATLRYCELHTILHQGVLICFLWFYETALFLKCTIIVSHYFNRTRICLSVNAFYIYHFLSLTIW